MNKLFLYFILFFILSNQCVLSQEETLNDSIKNPILTNKFHIGFGLFIPTQRINFGVDAFSEDDLIEFDENFDFKNNTARPQFYFDWHFAKNWKLAAEYFNASYSKKAVLENDIEAGGFKFENGTYVKIGYKLKLYRTFIGRTISSGLKHELGGGLGFHFFNVGPFIEGNVIVNENDFEFKDVNLSVTAPLPNIALWYYFAPTEKWSFTARLDWFGLSVNEYSSYLWDFGPSVRYQIIKNMAITVDYRYFKVNLDVNKDYWNGNVNFTFSGPTITLIGNF